jgi:hypothetical protein
VLINISSLKQNVDGLEAQIAELLQTKTTLEEAIVNVSHCKEEQLLICSLETEIASRSTEMSSMICLLAHGLPRTHERIERLPETASGHKR